MICGTAEKSIERTTRVSRSSRRGRIERLSGRRLARTDRGRDDMGHSPSKYEPDERYRIGLGSVFPLRFCRRSALCTESGRFERWRRKPSGLTAHAIRRGRHGPSTGWLIDRSTRRSSLHRGPCSMSGRVSARPEETHRCDSAMHVSTDREVDAPSRDGPPAAGARRRASANILSREPAGNPLSRPPDDDVQFTASGDVPPTARPFDVHKLRRMYKDFSLPVRPGQGNGILPNIS